MTKLKFNDGITIQTDGPLRTLSLPDGLYVIGHGMSIPVRDQDEAQELIQSLTKNPTS